LPPFARQVTELAAQWGKLATRAYLGGNADMGTGRLLAWPGLFDAAFVAAWGDLAENAAEPNVFAESWFLRPALECFDPRGQVQIFAYWQEDRLCGLLPLASERRYGRWTITHVQNWLHHNAFLGTPLIRKGREQGFWTAFLAQLDVQPGQALFFHGHTLDSDGPAIAALEAVCQAQGRRLALVQQSQRAFLRNGLAPDAYLDAAMRSKKRKELRRQRNRLSEMGALTFARDDSTTGLAEWTAEFLALEERGWKGRNGSALASAETTRALFAEVVAGAATQGKLERLDLRLDGKPLAMLVNFHTHEGSFSFKTAFDEDYARFSPGVLLQIENLALLDRPDFRWCDSCAVEGHPMIDSLWTERRRVGRYSVAIGGAGRRAIFGALLKAELGRMNREGSK
jgi:CelD/BcsL family acetyltransferase involved in cellulose biosynthesis